MAQNDRWLLPEGIEEVLPAQAERLESLRRKLLDMYHGWGYQLVMPPQIEYLESLLTGTGNDLELQTFKLTDQLTGRMMGLRADMTPQVARIDAHHLRREGPSRLCYMGSVLKTLPEGPGGSRSPLQVGVELYGHSGVESDVEVLQLMLQTLQLAGIEDTHLDLGHVGIYRGLMSMVSLSDEQEGQLFDALQRKAKPEVEALLNASSIDNDVKQMLLRLADLNGGEEVLDEAEQVFAGAGDETKAALTAIRQVAELLKHRLPGISVHYDLAELRGYHYHTGVVFAAYLPGHGQAIAQGGRYDDIGMVFGRARAATGFSTDLKTLSMLGTPEVNTTGAIFAPHDTDPALLARIQGLRESGERVVQELPGQKGGPGESGCDRVLVKRADSWEVEGL
ncbi:MAG: ATP phosphoribosyltransferase regulatory subunit [Gammaproteobacteria bacterium]|nr:ATP phosphoribosyltransferase regulatory subunit [Gammaproteobacteria bacterium]